MEEAHLAPSKADARSRSRSQVRQPDATQARSKSRSRAPEGEPKAMPIIGKAGAGLKTGSKKGMAPEEDGRLTFLPSLAFIINAVQRKRSTQRPARSRRRRVK